MSPEPKIYIYKITLLLTPSTPPRRSWFELSGIGFIYKEKQDGKVLGDVGLLMYGNFTINLGQKTFGLTSIYVTRRMVGLVPMLVGC